MTPGGKLSIHCLCQLQSFMISLKLGGEFSVSIPCRFVFYSTPQSLEANWRRGHYTLTRVETGSMALCLQCDDNKIVTGQGDSTIKVGSFCCAN